MFSKFKVQSSKDSWGEIDHCWMAVMSICYARTVNSISTVPRDMKHDVDNLKLFLRKGVQS